MKRAALIAICWILLVWLSAYTFSFFPPTPESPPPKSSNPLDRWDASFYRALATDDISQPRRDAFFPLFPGLAKLGIRLTGWSFAAVSAVLNTTLALVDILLFSSVLRHKLGWNENAVRWAILAFLALPTSFVLLAPYPVALLIFFMLLAWLGVKRREPLMAMSAACLGFLTHQTGIILIISVMFVMFRWQWTLKTLTAASILATTAILVLASGFLLRFLTAQQGFTIYDGIPFWKIGVLYLLNTTAPPLRIIQVLAIIAHALFLIIAIRRWRRIEPWFSSSSAWFLLLAVGSGAWTSVSRYLLPALVVPLTIAQLRPIQRTTVLIVSFLTQLLWLYGFVTWTTHV